MASDDEQDERGSTKRVAMGKVQISVYVAGEIAEAARDAVIATTAYRKGFQSLSDLVAEAVAEKIARLEKQFNNGKPFPKRLTDLQPGRPIR